MKEGYDLAFCTLTGETKVNFETGSLNVYLTVRFRKSQTCYGAKCGYTFGILNVNTLNESYISLDEIVEKIKENYYEQVALHYPKRSECIDNLFENCLGNVKGYIKTLIQNDFETRIIND